MTWSTAWPGGRLTALTLSVADGQRVDAHIVALLLKGAFNRKSGILAHGDAGTGIRRDELAALCLPVWDRHDF